MPPKQQASIKDKILRHFVDTYPDCTFQLVPSQVKASTSTLTTPPRALESTSTTRPQVIESKPSSQVKSSTPTPTIIVQQGDIMRSFIPYIQSLKSKQPSIIAAMVNAANEECLGGGGIDKAYAVKFPDLLAERQKLQIVRTTKKIRGNVTVNIRCPTGDAKITKPGRNNDNIDYIIHAVGPQCNAGVTMTDKQTKLLYDAYVASIQRARENNVTHIAFPLLSSGLYHCTPKTSFDLAIQALQTTPSTLQQAYIYVFDKKLDINRLLTGHKGQTKQQGIIIQP
jgi:O-acetyl-ADP-ribose deacetylase (regulator of RNase III)